MHIADDRKWSVGLLAGEQLPRRRALRARSRPNRFAGVIGVPPRSYDLKILSQDAFGVIFTISVVGPRRLLDCHPIDVNRAKITAGTIDCAYIERCENSARRELPDTVIPIRCSLRKNKWQALRDLLTGHVRWKPGHQSRDPAIEVHAGSFYVISRGILTDQPGERLQIIQRWKWRCFQLICRYRHAAGHAAKRLISGGTIQKCCDDLRGNRRPFADGSDDVQMVLDDNGAVAENEAHGQSCGDKAASSVPLP